MDEGFKKLKNFLFTEERLAQDRWARLRNGKLLSQITPIEKAALSIASSDKIRIISAACIDENTRGPPIEAEVTGSDPAVTYSVSIFQGKNDTLCSCNCPATCSLMCKHIRAVILYQFGDYTPLGLTLDSPRFFGRREEEEMEEGEILENTDESFRSIYESESENSDVPDDQEFRLFAEQLKSDLRVIIT